MGPPASPLSALARAALLSLVALVPAVFWRGALEPFESTKAALLHLGALLLAACLVCSRARPGSWREPITLAVLLVFASAAVSTIFSISPRTSFWGAHQSQQGLITAASLLVVFFAARSFFRDVRAVASAVAVAVVLSGGYALLQLARLDPFAWVQTSDFAGYVRPIGSLGHPNYLAGFLVMALPLLAWRWRQGGWWRWAALAAVGVAVVVIVAALSRAAWLAALVLLPLPLLWLRWRQRLLVGGAAVALLGAMGVMAWLGLLGPLGERLYHLGEGSSRLAIWSAAWRSFRESPLTGSGTDTFQLAFPRHRGADYWDLEWGMTPTRAHDDPLHLLATQGSLGGLCYLLLAAAVVVSLVRVWRQPDQRGITVALVGVSLAYHVQNLFGFPVIATALLHAVVVGCLSRLALGPASGGREPPESVALAEVSSHRGLKPPARLLRPLLAAPVVLVAAWFLVCRPFASWCLLRSAQEALEQDPAAAVALCERAVARSPWSDVHHAHLAVARHRAALTLNDDQLLTRAADASHRARDLVPVAAHHHALHARILLDLARRDLARPDDVWRAYDDSMTLDPSNPLVPIDAARAALALGRNDVARRYLDRSDLIELPQLTAERGALALAEGRLDEAERLLHAAVKGDWRGQNDAQQRAHGLLALACLRRGNASGALEHSDAVLRAYPRPNAFEPAARWVRASALERLGRLAEAREEFGQVLALRPDHAGAREALLRLSR